MRWAAGSCAWIVLPLLGCAGTPEPRSMSSEKACHLEFPDKAALLDRGEIHDVQIVVETESATATDLPALRPAFRPDDGTEIYSLGAGERLEYGRGFFTAGGVRLAARRGARLFLFRARQGTWSFRYRGLNVVVEREGAWQPALLWNAVFAPAGAAGDGDGRARRITGVRDQGKTIFRENERPMQELEREEIQLATARLLPIKFVFHLRDGLLEVQGLRVTPRPGDTVVLGPRGAPELRRSGAAP